MRFSRGRSRLKRPDGCKRLFGCVFETNLNGDSDFLGVLDYRLHLPLT